MTSDESVVEKVNRHYQAGFGSGIKSIKPQLTEAERTIADMKQDALEDRAIIRQQGEQIEEMQALLDECEKELDFYARHHHRMDTTAPNFAREMLTRLKQRKDIS